MSSKHKITKTVDLSDFLKIPTSRDNGKWQLKIVVDKSYRGGSVDVSASVNELSGGFETHRLYQDYNTTLHREPCKRVTAKAVQRVADEYLTEHFIQTIMGDVLLHYAADIEAARLAKKLAA